MNLYVTKLRASLKVYAFIAMILMTGQVLGRDWELVKPKPSKKVILLITETERIYHQLDNQQNSNVEVVGPGFLPDYHPDLVIVMNPIYKDEIQHMCREMKVSSEIIIA